MSGLDSGKRNEKSIEGLMQLWRGLADGAVARIVSIYPPSTPEEAHLFAFQRIRGKLVAFDTKGKPYTPETLRTYLREHNLLSATFSEHDAGSAHPRDEKERKRLEFIALVSERIPALRKTAYNYTKNWDDADELVLTVREKAISKWESFKEGTNIGAWLFIITRNQYFSQQRKEKRVVRGEAAELAIQNAVAPENDAADALTVKQVWQRAESLPLEQRDAIIAIFKDGLSYDEAAARAGVAVGTIKSRVHRGIKALQSSIGPLGDE